MPPRQPYIYPCDMIGCDKKAITYGLCSYHYNRLLYLRKKVRNKSYSITYERLDKRLKRTTEPKLRKKLEQRLKELPEYKKIHREIKKIESCMNPNFRRRPSRVNPKKGLRQRKRKPLYTPKGKKEPQICTECGKNFIRTKGLCNTCYERKRRNKNNFDICHLEECQKPAERIWLCRHHYDVWYRYRKMIKTRRYDAELSHMVDKAEGKGIWSTLHPDQRKYISDEIDKRLSSRYERQHYKAKKIRKEFARLDAAADMGWRDKHRKKHEKPPIWTGYKKYGPYTARIRHSW